jgi:hypothetical protein
MAKYASCSAVSNSPETGLSAASHLVVNWHIDSKNALSGIYFVTAE